MRRKSIANAWPLCGKWYYMPYVLCDIPHFRANVLLCKNKARYRSFTVTDICVEGHLFCFCSIKCGEQLWNANCQFWDDWGVITVLISTCRVGILPSPWSATLTEYVWHSRWCCVWQTGQCLRTKLLLNVPLAWLKVITCSVSYFSCVSCREYTIYFLTNSTIWKTYG